MIKLTKRHVYFISLRTEIISLEGRGTGHEQREDIERITTFEKKFRNN